jgi:nicotinamide riboside kinase
VSENDILVIANGQRELEKFIIGNDDDNDSMVISDTDIIYTKYLSIYHLGTYPKILDKYISEQSYDLYLLLNNDVSSIKGNTMISPKTRNWQFNCLKVQLDSLGKDYAIIEGKDHDERFVDCLNQIELIL